MTEKIYVASSWRNTMHQGVVHILRAAKFEVYDFRNPTTGLQREGSRGKGTGFQWDEVYDGPPDKTWRTWTPEQYIAALKHPRALEGFNNDHEAMEWADTCVLVLPCGRSAHLEAGEFIGKGKKLYILLDETFEPELMYKGATGVCCSMPELLEMLGVPND